VLVCTRRSLLRNIGSAGVVALSFPEPMAAALLPYHKRVLAKHPVAYWRFEEQTGPTARDGTSYAHAGTYRGGVGFRQIGPIRSERDAAIGLNGLDAFVEVPDSEAFSQPSSRRGLTVEAWFRPDKLTFSGQTEQHYVHWLGKGQTGAFDGDFASTARSRRGQIVSRRTYGISLLNLASRTREPGPTSRTSCS
jgi:hypothetical protein